jgi:Kef-type K+ transport system membrane component KefB
LAHDAFSTAQFFLAVAVILAACHVAGRIVGGIGQPRVIGEMLAGLVLGPSVFGALLPELQRSIFPGSLRDVLQAVSQIGLVLYMFTIGLEFDAGLIRGRVRGAVAVSLAGVLAPLGLGAGLAWFIAGDPRLFPPGVPSATAMLFLGAAMAVTAFPVLSRILSERGLTDSPVGSLALAAGSVDDAIAWCLLALVLAMLSGAAYGAWIAIGGGVVYVGATLALRRALLGRLAAAAERAGPLPSGLLICMLALLMLGAWFTELVGIHAVFGAFVLGVAVPRGALATNLVRTIAPVTAGLLLPLFFAFSGLHTELQMIAAPDLLLLALLVVAAATAGKLGACWAAARLSGLGSREAFALGALMNARGLMELIMLNIGLARGIIGPALFSVMVLMALATTIVAAPLFGRAYDSPEEDGRRSPSFG